MTPDRLIVVTGLGSSGTSFVAGVLERRFDLNFGAHVDGRRENKAFRTYLSTARRDDHPDELVRANLRKHVEDLDDEGADAMKDPRLSDVLSVAVDALPDAAWIVCMRDVEQTARSWARKWPTTYERALHRVEKRAVALRLLTENIWPFPAAESSDLTALSGVTPERGTLVFDFSERRTGDDVEQAIRSWSEEHLDIDT